jgi:hypothetical protein
MRFYPQLVCAMDEAPLQCFPVNKKVWRAHDGIAVDAYTPMLKCLTVVPVFTLDGLFPFIFLNVTGTTNVSKLPLPDAIPGKETSIRQVLGGESHWATTQSTLDIFVVLENYMEKRREALGFAQGTKSVLMLDNYAAHVAAARVWRSERPRSPLLLYFLEPLTTDICQLGDCEGGPHAILKQRMTQLRNREVADLVEKKLEDGKPMEHVVLDFRWGAWKAMVASMLVHAIQGVTRGTVLRAVEQQGIVNALDPVVQESAREAADEGVLEYLPKEAPAEEGYEEDVLVESTTDQRKGGLADLYQDEPDDRKRKRHKKKKDAESAEGSESESASSSHSPRESARQQPRRVLEGKLITFVEKRRRRM